MLPDSRHALTEAQERGARGRQCLCLWSKDLSAREQHRRESNVALSPMSSPLLPLPSEADFASLGPPPARFPPPAWTEHMWRRRASHARQLRSPPTCRRLPPASRPPLLRSTSTAVVAVPRSLDKLLPVAVLLSRVLSCMYINTKNYRHLPKLNSKMGSSGSCTFPG